MWNVGLTHGLTCRNRLIETIISTYILAIGERSQRSKCEMSMTKIYVCLRWKLMAGITKGIASMSLVMAIIRSMVGNEAPVLMLRQIKRYLGINPNIYPHLSQFQFNLSRGSRHVLKYHVLHFREDRHILSHRVISSREDLTMPYMIMFYPLEAI